MSYHNCDKLLDLTLEKSDLSYHNCDKPSDMSSENPKEANTLPKVDDICDYQVILGPNTKNSTRPTIKPFHLPAYLLFIL